MMKEEELVKTEEIELIKKENIIPRINFHQNFDENHNHTEGKFTKNNL